MVAEWKELTMAIKRHVKETYTSWDPADYLRSDGTSGRT